MDCSLIIGYREAYPSFTTDSYGAVGDGLTDDTVALNLLFSKAPPGVTIRIHPEIGGVPVGCVLTEEAMTRKVRPKHVSALVLRQLACARQPMTGRRDARLLAGMLDFSVSKYFLASANILERQQDFVSVSK